MDGAEIRTDHRYRMRTEEPDDNNGENTDYEYHRRGHQHLGRLGDPDQVDGSEQNKPDHRHGQQVMRQHRKDAAQAGCPGCQTDRNGQDVVDDQARRSQQAHRPAEFLFGHRVGPATVRVDRDHLPIRHHQHQQQHRDRCRDRQGQPDRGRTLVR